MTDHTANHTLELMREIRGQVGEMRNELHDLTGEVRSMQRSMDGHFAVILHQLDVFVRTRQDEANARVDDQLE